MSRDPHGNGGEGGVDDAREKLNARGRAEWKAQQRRVIISRVVRWSIAIPLMLLSFPLFWFGPFLMLLGVIMIVPDIAHWLSAIGDHIIWSHRGSDPAPLYGVPESLAAKGRYAEAEEEYEKIIREFPKEVKPHLDMINIAVTRLNDGELAAKLYERGMSVLKDDAAKETLTRMYTAIASRLRKPSCGNRPAPGGALAGGRIPAQPGDAAQK